MADKRKVTVYGIVHKDDPDHIRYIGQTTNLISRKACHRQLTKNGSNTDLYVWMRKNPDKIGYAVIDKSALWDITEINQIKKHRTSGHSLLNQTDGGTGALGYQQTQDHIDKVQRSRAGYQHSEETKKRISKSNSGKKHPNKKPAPPISDETRERMRTSRSGVELSDETKKKMSVAHIGKKMPNRKPFSDEYKKEHSQRMKLWWKMRKESANG